MKKTHTLIAAFAMILCLQAVSFGQQEISESKQKLIDELIVIMDVKKSSDNITDLMMASQEELLVKVVDETLKNHESNPEIAAKTGEITKASFKRVSEKLKVRMRELDWDSFYRDLFYDIYDKYFTENDLRNMIDFYRTETGKKVLNSETNIYSDTMKAMGEKMMPQLVKIIGEVSEEETQRLRQDLEKVYSSQ